MEQRDETDFILNTNILASAARLQLPQLDSARQFDWTGDGQDRADWRKTQWNKLR